MVAVGGVLFRRGEPRENVIAYFLKRYGSELGITTFDQMERVLFVKTRGSHPNFAELFENKSRDDVTKSYHEWVRKREERAANIRASIAKRLSDPLVRQTVSDRSKRVMGELHRDPTFVSKQSASASKTLKLWRNDPEGRKQYTQHMRALRSDPGWNQKLSENVSMGMHERWLASRKKKMNEIIEDGALHVEEFSGNRWGKRRARILVAGPPTTWRTTQEVQRVQRTLTRLTDIEREAIIQLFFDKRPISKVAKSLNQPEKTIYQIVGPAYKKIMRAFRGQ